MRTRTALPKGLVQDMEPFIPCSGVGSIHIWAKVPKIQRHSLLVVLPEDHPAVKVTQQKCFLCISQVADATWGKCVKPVTPRALRKTGYKTKAFLNFEECLQT